MYGNEAKAQGQYAQAALAQDVQMMRHPDRMIVGNGEPKREPEVAAELSRLGKAVDEFGAVSKRLMERLMPMRRQTGAGIAGNITNAPEPVLCGIATVIRDRRQAVERYTAQLRRALEELEI